MTDNGISDEATAQMDGKESTDEWDREANREILPKFEKRNLTWKYLM